MNTTATIYHQDGTSETLGSDQARYKVYMSGGSWGFTPLPPPGWDRIVPIYKATRDLRPAELDRHRSEPPFSKVFVSDVWQYGERPIKRGEVIETRAWPHESFSPLNYGAGKVLDYFNMRQKGRLGRSPWFVDRIRLDDGLSGPTSFEVKSPKPQPMNTRPAA
jgi:hypothetical protein